MQQPQLSVPVPHLQFTRSTQRTVVDNNKNSNEETHKDSNVDDNGNNDKDDKDKETKKPQTRIEYIYENNRSVIRICNNIISFEGKLSAPDINTFEFCDMFSYEGGGCLKLLTRDHRLYHR